MVSVPEVTGYQTKSIVLGFSISFATQVVGRKEVGAKSGGLQEAGLGGEHAGNSGLKARRVPIHVFPS